jgi:hypothetical protein
MRPAGGQSSSGMVHTQGGMAGRATLLQAPYSHLQLQTRMPCYAAALTPLCADSVGPCCQCLRVTVHVRRRMQGRAVFALSWATVQATVKFCHFCCCICNNTWQYAALFNPWTHRLWLYAGVLNSIQFQRQVSCLPCSSCAYLAVP